jgi:3'(2'), 5'-bisphosphate nucleotidase
MKELLQLCLQASESAGDEIMKVYATDFSVVQKDDDSPLTLADQAGHNKIMEFLQTTDYPVLSEEGKHLSYDERKKWNRFWLVDPLDGTKEFVKRNGEFTVNIALIEDGIPIMGVVYVPVKDEMYYGSESGAYKVEGYKNKNKPQQLPLPQKDRQFTIVGSRSHMSAETESYFNEMKEIHGEIELLAVGSSLKLCMVAEGKADVYPRYAPTMEWDTAAGHAVALAAGFNVLKYNSDQSLAYNKEELLNPWFIVK